LTIGDDNVIREYVSIHRWTADAREQIRQLREQVDSRMRERVTPAISDAGGRAQPEEVHRWLGLLRSVSAYEAYIRLTPGGVQPAAVAAFLLLIHSFPRSVAFGCRRVHEEIDAIDRDLGIQGWDGPARIAGALASRLRYARIAESGTDALLRFLLWIEQQCNAIGDGVRRIYFEGSAADPAGATG